MSSFVDIMQAVADQIVRLRDRLDELERLETYYGTLDLNGYTLTVTANTTLSGTPADAVHTHAASDIVSGTMAAVRLGSGASASTVLHGDQTFSAVDILAETTGTLSIARGGTGATSAGAALSALGGVGASHSHAASDITSGTMNTARLGSGTASASTLLFGDSTWAALAATDIPSLDASKITTGTLPLTRGGTGATSAAGALSSIGAAAASHAHAASDITSGTVNTARLGSGTANSTTVLYGNSTWGTAGDTVTSGSTTNGEIAYYNGTKTLNGDTGLYYNPSTEVLNAQGGISTGGQTWVLSAYTAGAPVATGYVSISVNGTTRKLLAG